MTNTIDNKARAQQTFKDMQSLKFNKVENMKTVPTPRPSNIFQNTQCPPLTFEEGSFAHLNMLEARKYRLAKEEEKNDD